ncbi:hypothetical protein RUND412_004972 [Rhizina undulata]
MNSTLSNPTVPKKRRFEQVKEPRPFWLHPILAEEMRETKRRNLSRKDRETFIKYVTSGAGTTHFPAESLKVLEKRFNEYYHGLMNMLRE